MSRFSAGFLIVCAASGMVGCPAKSSTTVPDPNWPRTYVLRTAELQATYRFPAPAEAPELAELERLRDELDGDPPDGPFVQVSVDNRRGETAFIATQVAVLRPGGEQIPLQAAGILIKEWAAAAHPSQSLERWFALADEPRYSGLVPAGQQATVILYLVTADVEPKIERVTTSEGEDLVS